MADPPALEIGSEGARRIYAFVERQGAVTPREVWEHLEMAPVEFHHELAILRRDDIVRKADGKLRVVREAGAAEEFRSDGLEFVVRPARQEDLSGIVGAIRQAAGEQRSIVAESVAEQIQREDALIRHNEAESRMFFVATVREEVVGWAHLEGSRLAKLAHTAELTLGVLEAYRRYGIGSQLLHRGLGWAIAEGYEKVYNSLPATNTEAITFLLGQGFDIEAVRSDHYRLGESYTDEVMLAHGLAPASPVFGHT